ncbi:MAG: thiamine phosphate synthase [Cytophagales bacterium]
MNQLPKLIFISDGESYQSQIDSIKYALAGGVQWVQLRCKNFELDELEGLALEVQEMCTEFGAMLSINDHPELALKILAEGVHLGKNDMPLNQAKQLIGENLILGATANTFDDIKVANEKGVDYVGLGPFKFTNTKKNLSPVLGFNGFESALALMRENNINVPVYAIGGLTIEDVDSLLNIGVYGFAVSSAITKTHSPSKEAEKWVQKLS